MEIGEFIVPVFFFREENIIQQGIGSVALKVELFYFLFYLLRTNLDYWK